MMATAKEEVEALLGKLPKDCSLEDIQYHLYVLEKVRNGIEAAETEGTVPQEEAEAQLSKWITE
jgi:predicted transcriptional regulator